MKFFLTLVFLLSLSVFSVVAFQNIVSATSIDDLDEQISVLLKEVKTLQAKLNNISQKGDQQPIIDLKRNLKLGDYGEDVRKLQKFLNNDDRTTVAQKGAGAKGQETQYFGAQTWRAVSVFQDIYKSDVLSPVGLRVGNGFVGTLTRKKIKEISELRQNTQVNSKNASIANTIVKTDLSSDLSSHLNSDLNPDLNIGKSFIQNTIGDSVNFSILTKEEKNEFNKLAYPPVDEEKMRYVLGDDLRNKKILIFDTSDYVAYNGAVITLSGVGFDTREPSELYFDDLYKLDIEAQDIGDTKIKFVVPNDLPYGHYELRLKNYKGMSNQKMFINKDPNSPAPYIEYITPTRGADATEVEIHGKNFDLTENYIYASYGIIKDLASYNGGTVIKFKVRPFPRLTMRELAGLTLTDDLKMYFYVANKNGLSDKNNPAVFSIYFLQI